MNRSDPKGEPYIIGEFEGDYFFLSNFSPHPVHIDGVDFPTAEHAFQALKTDSEQERLSVRDAATPSEAKRRGRKVTLREDWDQLRIPAMHRVVRAKFENPELRRRLLATGDAQLIEGNWWGDQFWGVSKGRGENQLGRLLMQLRDELRSDE